MNVARKRFSFVIAIDKSTVLKAHIAVLFSENQHSHEMVSPSVSALYDSVCVYFPDVVAGLRPGAGGLLPQRRQPRLGLL